MENYPPTISELLAISHPISLGPGTPNTLVAERLGRLDPATLFAPHPIQDMDMARACLAGLWLRFDHLDPSHRISQELHSPEGSFWHAIMHRREGDFGNSKYWWRRVGQHAVFPALAIEAHLKTWDPFAFVDRVEQNEQGESQVLERLQDREWHVLFDYCLRAAWGR